MIKEINTSIQSENEIIGCIIEFEEENLYGNAKAILGKLTERGCVENISHTDDMNGYSHFCRKGTNWKIHRYIFHKYCEEIPEGMVVMHKCDNPKCINPDHLQLGTQKDNVRDMIRKGRDRFGKRKKAVEVFTIHHPSYSGAIGLIIFADLDEYIENSLMKSSVEVWAA